MMKDKVLKLLLVDNHDSFTWNLVELFRTRCKCNVKILISEEAQIADPEEFDGIVFSPGPGVPYEQPAMFRLLEKIEKSFAEGKSIPVMGVCLGLQAIALHYGGTLFSLQDVFHGQPRKLKITDKKHFLFKGIPDHTEVGLYHSWAADKATLPSVLRCLAVSEDRTVMALQHVSLPVTGVQFHPESIMTPMGEKMMRNWLESF